MVAVLYSYVQLMVAVIHYILTADGCCPIFIQLMVAVTKRHYS